MRDAQLRAVKFSLQADGWTFDRIVPSATLPVATAAGGRTAVASLAIKGSVQWEYVSEGNNILSTDTTFVPEDATSQETAQLMKAALIQVRNKIDNSYARSLYLKFPDRAESAERKEILDSIRTKLAQGQMMVIDDEDYIWFIRTDGEVRWMYSQIDQNPRNRRYWPSSVGTIVTHVLAKAEALASDDPRIIQYEATLPTLGAWLKS